MGEIFPKLELVRGMPKILSHVKNQPWGSSSFFNQFCTYKHTKTYRHFNCVLIAYIQRGQMDQNHNPNPFSNPFSTGI